MYVDNYDDVKNNTPEVNRPIVLAEIDKNINTYFAKHNGIVRKYENDKYLIIIENHGFKCIETKKFDILDQIERTRFRKYNTYYFKYRSWSRWQ